jgi:hypothetical protein
MSEIDKIFDNKYIMPSDEEINNFVDKLYNTFDYSKEILLDYNTIQKKCKILLEKTIKNKWNKSLISKDTELCIKKFLLSIYDIDKKEVLNYVNEFIDIEDNKENIITKLNNINLKIKQDIILEYEVDKYILLYNKSVGKKNLEVIIEDFVEKELLLSFNKYKDEHYNNIIKFINNTTIISDMIDMDNTCYEYYWVQPRLDFNNNIPVKCIDIYKGGYAITDKRTLEYTMKMGQLSGELIKSHLPFPHDCEYEKTFWPFAVITKKKYVGNKYEFDVNKYKQDFMGIVLIRRDNAPIVKEICSGIIDYLINKKNPIKAKDYTISCLNDLFSGKYDIKYFLQSRSLKLKESYKDWTRIAHVYLANKITQREIGNAPQSGDRIEFAVVKVESDNKKLLQGEIIETPEYIKANNLEIDYLFYLTNQIMNPALQFLELVDKNAINIFNDFISKYSNKKPKKIKEIKIKEIKIKEVKIKEVKIKEVKIKDKVKEVKVKNISKVEECVINILNGTHIDNKEKLNIMIKKLIKEIKKNDN